MHHTEPELPTPAVTRLGESPLLKLRTVQPKAPPHPQEPPVAIAAWTASPLQIDGHLDKAIWLQSRACELMLPKSHVREGRTLQEGGRARFAWSDRFLYVGLDLQDSDIVAEGSADGQMHNALGDTCELLIKPENETWYWEFHVTPAGHASSFFFPGKGRLGLPSCLAHSCGVIVAAVCDGTLNDWTDRDRGWTAEMAIPLAELAPAGGEFDPASRWRALVGRYNYSRYLETRGPELSTAPQAARPDFHSFEDYALLRFVR